MRFLTLLSCCLLLASGRAFELAPTCVVAIRSAGMYMTVLDQNNVGLTMTPSPGANQRFTVVVSLGLFSFQTETGAFLARRKKKMVTIPVPTLFSVFGFVQRPAGGYYMFNSKGTGENVTECPANTCGPDHVGFTGTDPVVFEVDVMSCPQGVGDWLPHPLNEPFLPPISAGMLLALMPERDAVHICDDCVQPGVANSIAAGNTATIPKLVVKDMFNGFFALQTESGRFLRMCGDCYTTQTKPVLMADGTDPTDDAAQFSFSLNGPDPLVGKPPIILKTGGFLSICATCVPGAVTFSAEPVRERRLGIDVFATTSPVLGFCNGRGYTVLRSGASSSTELPSVDLNGAAEFAATEFFPLSLTAIPPSLAAGGVTQPQVLPEPAGTELVLDCCGDEDCDFFVAVYRCKGCPSANGDLPLLLSSGDEPWASGSCAPQFSKPTDLQNPFASPPHPMHTFYKRVKSKEVLTLDPLTAPAEALVIFGSQATTSGSNDWCHVVVQQGPFPLDAPCAAQCFQP
ncbi:hypothetical protein DIPPA_14403 [Diplonema papillatum]|nr:hypothetical protein DIPPA_14403 [Diplonema papillatum]